MISPICSICEKLRDAVLEASHRHMATLMRVDHATDRNAIRSLEEAGRRLDEATSAFKTHQQLDARAPQRATRFNGLRIVERIAPRDKTRGLVVVPRRRPRSLGWLHGHGDGCDEANGSPLPPAA